MKHLKPGDHLVVDISNSTMVQYTYYAGAKHHGIYISDGIVIHFNAQLDEITTDTLDCFSGGCTVNVKRHACIPRRAIAIAYSKLGESGYHLLTNNCEHFVNDCLDDHQTSSQVADNYHVSAHLTARLGLLGRGATELAKGPIGIVTVGSTLAKNVGESIGLPDRVNTVIGTPGDLIAKPIESCLNGLGKTLSDTSGKLSSGDLTGAAGALISGVAETAIDTVFTPAHVIVKCWDAIWD